MSHDRAPISDSSHGSVVRGLDGFALEVCGQRAGLGNVLEEGVAMARVVERLQLALRLAPTERLVVEDVRHVGAG